LNQEKGLNGLNFSTLSKISEEEKIEIIKLEFQLQAEEKISLKLDLLLILFLSALFSIILLTMNNPFIDSFILFYLSYLSRKPTTS
jgi:hypothetical protein